MLARMDLTSGDVFVVDDNERNLSLLVAILRERGYKVRLANSGRAALAMIRAKPPEIVLLDIDMPGMSGYEVCRELKQFDDTRDIPVVFLSALDDIFDKVKAFEAGGVDYVTKPYQPLEVLARVSTQLGLARLRKELARKNDELARKNVDLTRAFEDSDAIFATLSRVLPGTTLDAKYRLEERIGAGGFGVVYKATHLDLGHSVAVKVLRATAANLSPAAMERFRLEGVSACRFGHPNAVSVYDFAVSSKGIAYLVMELLDGRTLADEIAEVRTVSVARAVEVVRPICGALAAAHAAGVIHRDVKPENVFLHRAGGREVVKVVDFGVAKLVATTPPTASQQTSVNRFVGTPAYIAPERLLERPYDGLADVYSIGVMLYRMLSGRLPFGKDDALAALVVASLRDEPEPLARHAPGVPPRLAALVMGALAKDPAARPTAEELERELAEA
jgi:CheY-like chemotaxis protein